MRGAVATDRGRVRPTNQDAIALFNPSDPTVRARDGVVLVVADGMGGHAGETLPVGWQWKP